MKTALLFGAFLFVAGVVLGLLQLWFSPWSAAMFLRLEMTDGALLLIVLVLYFIVKEYREDKSNRSGDRLDG